VVGRTFFSSLPPPCWLVWARTGFPAAGTTSVTVIHSDSTTADAAATALFVAGPEEWFEIAGKMGLTQVLLIDQLGTLHMTPAMQQRLNLTDSSHRIEISPPLPPATTIH